MDPADIGQPDETDTVFEDFDGMNLELDSDTKEPQSPSKLQELFDFLTSSDPDYLEDSDDDDDEAPVLQTTTLEPVLETGPDRTKIVVLRRDPETSDKEESSEPKRTYLLATDLSSESLHAFEWTVGTVLRSGDRLHVVSVLEDKIASGGGSRKNRQSTGAERLEIGERIANHARSLLDDSRFPVCVIIEVIAAKNPKPMLTDMIDHIKPTMVIVGSRGRSAIKGILLGSISNYLVQNSSVPVMVARRHFRKQKIGRKKRVTTLNPIFEVMKATAEEVKEVEKNETSE